MENVHEGQRVAVLADAQNLYHSAQSLYSRNIDYAALLETAVEDRSLVRAMGGAGLTGTSPEAHKAEAPETSFLLDAVENEQAPRTFQATLKPMWDYNGWGGDLFGLLTRVEQRKQARQAG